MLAGIKLKILGVIVVIVAAGSGYLGWATRDAFCDAAHYKRELDIANGRADSLQTQINVAHAADAENKRLAALDREALEKIQGTIDGMVAKISSGECFTADDVDRLRNDIWRTGRDKPAADSGRHR